jgi:transposase InsO family protein
MDHDVQARLKWVQMYLDTGEAGLTCRRCGISRPTLRKWVRRYQAEGLEGLTSRSRRPHTSPNRKVTDEIVEWILTLRTERRLGPRRLQYELQRLYDCSLSIDTIHRVLCQHQVPPLRRPRRRKVIKRYEKKLPGERVQLDTTEIAPGRYQYTVIDDFSRFLVAELYPRRTAAHTLDFVELVLDSYTVPVQVIQTDRGQEFMAFKVQQHLRGHRIKFRPIRPGSPHLNGKVERVQRTVKEEFYSSLSVRDYGLDELNDELGSWVMFYNYQRFHSAFGETPVHRSCSRIHDAPLWGEVYEAYDEEAEDRYHRHLELELFKVQTQRS